MANSVRKKTTDLPKLSGPLLTEELLTTDPATGAMRTATLQKVQQLLLADVYTKEDVDLITGSYKGIATAAMVPDPTPGFYLTTEAGVYTHFGNLVVNASSFAAIGSVDGTNWTVTQATIDMNSYLAKTDWLTSGKNLLNKATFIQNSYYFSAPTVGVIYPASAAPNTGFSRSPLIAVLPNTTYTVSGVKNTVTGHEFGAAGNFINTIGETTTAKTKWTFTTGSTTRFIGLNIHNATGSVTQDNTAQLEIGSINTRYESYFGPGVGIDRIYPFAVKQSDFLLQTAKTDTYSRTGKNLLNKSVFVSNEYFASNGNSGSLPNWRRSGYVAVLPSTTYMFSGVSFSFAGNYYDANMVFISAIQAAGSVINSLSFTTPNNAAYVGLNIVSNNLGQLTSFDDTAQLELGAAATDYERYFGYGVDAEHVVGNIEGAALATEAKIGDVIGDGKNLLDKSLIVQDSYWPFGGSTGQAGALIGWRRSALVPVLANTTYTVSGINVSYVGNEFDASGSRVATIGDNTSGQVNSRTFVTGTNTAFVGLNINNTDNPVNNNSAQLELGGSATTYEAYCGRGVSWNRVYGKPDIVLANDIVVVKTATTMEIYKRTGNFKDKWICVTMQRFTMAYSSGIASDYDIWRCSVLNEAVKSDDYSFSKSATNLVLGGEWETAIKENGAADFYGGATHGSEKKTNLIILADGRLIGETDVVNFQCKTLKIIQVSNLYQWNTTNLRATTTKQWIFSNDGLDFSQSLKWAAVATLVNCFLTMLPVSRLTNSVQVTTNALRDDTLEVVDVSTSGFVNSAGVANANKNTAEVTLWGDRLGVSISINKAWILNNSGFWVANATQYNKLYVDYSGAYTTTLNEVFKLSSKYRFEIK